MKTLIAIGALIVGLVFAVPALATDKDCCESGSSCCPKSDCCN